MDVHVGDWSFGDDERELPRATEPSDEDTAGFWAKSVTRTLGVYRLVR